VGVPRHVYIVGSARHFIEVIRIVPTAKMRGMPFEINRILSWRVINHG